MFLTDGSKRYNCTIIDLHERIVIASITDKHITADLAKRTLQKAISSQPGLDTSQLILHSDQGSQYTSKEFTEYCEAVGITQSMSKAGCPYDNAPMERYYPSLPLKKLKKASQSRNKQRKSVRYDVKTAYSEFDKIAPQSYSHVDIIDL